MILFWLFVLVGIFYLLAKICDDYFVESLEILVHRLKIPSDVAGATFMAMGSSAPELFTAIAALSRVGSENIGVGTIVGSAIFNILVIVGASAFVSTVILDWRPVVRDLLFYLISIGALIFVFFDGIVTFSESVFFLIIYLFYLLVLFFWKRFFPIKAEEINFVVETKEKEAKSKNIISSMIDFVFKFIFPNLHKNPNYWGITFLFSILFIAGLSFLLVEVAVEVARILHISEVVIALTILAAGTSIPDLISSIIVAKKGKGGMAISNAVGSNTFDILIGLGLPWMIFILWKKETVSVSLENLSASTYLLLGTVIALFSILVAQKFKIGRKVGIFLILTYVLYLVYSVLSVTAF